MQEPGKFEAEMAEIGASEVMKNILTSRKPGPLNLPKGREFKTEAESAVALPSWLSEEDLNYYATKFEQKGFTGGLNYYRNLDLYVTHQSRSTCYRSFFFAQDSREVDFLFFFFFFFLCGRNWELTAVWSGVQVKVPVKFIVGGLDMVYTTPGVKEYVHNGGFKRDVPYLQEVVVIADAGHFISQERAEEISSHIYDFIKKF